MREETHGGFSRIAGSYAAVRRAYPPALFAWLRRTCPADPGGFLVDLGCGPGTFARAAAGWWPRRIGLDRSDAMLRALRRGSPPTLAVQAVGEAIPLRDESVGAAVFSQSLHWMDPGRALAEVGRVLRPEGWLIACWQGWMSADAPLERSWSRGWREVCGDEAPRDPARPAMDAVEELVGVAAEQRFGEDQPWALDPDAQVEFLCSRAACGTVEEGPRRRLRAFFAEEARRRGPLVYSLSVQARVWSRGALRPRHRPRRGAT